MILTSLSFYLNNYERHFRPLADQDVKLFELGIDKGGSLLMWKDFFSRGTIVGLDLEMIDVRDASGRIHVFRGDQRDVNLLDRIGRECAPAGFDIIIDDASHIGEFTRISFWHLFDNHLKPGGFYVIEVWRVGYWKDWPDGKRYRAPSFKWLERILASKGFRRYLSSFSSHTQGMVGLIKQLMDELGMDAITNPSRGGPPQRFPRFRLMETCPGQVFIIKATKQDNAMVAEQLIGKPGAAKSI